MFRQSARLSVCVWNVYPLLQSADATTGSAAAAAAMASLSLSLSPSLSPFTVIHSPIVARTSDVFQGKKTLSRDYIRIKFFFSQIVPS